MEPQGAGQSDLAALLEFFGRLSAARTSPMADEIRPPQVSGGEARLVRFDTELVQSYTEDEDEDDDGGNSQHFPVPLVRFFNPIEKVPVVAIDCGLSRLGETAVSVLAALRAAMIIMTGEGHHARLYRTGPLELRTADKPLVLHAMGEAMGQDDFFVKLDRSDAANPKVIAVKPGAANHGQIYVDRLRNFLEKQVTALAVDHCDGGLLVIDGSTTLRTRDTPPGFLPHLTSNVHERGAAIVGVSKKSTLTVRDRPIQFWLDDVPRVACYRHLSPLLSQARRERNLGGIYVARLSALGPSYRIDVCAPDGVSDEVILNQFYSSCVGGATYPPILVTAHAMSYFTSPDLMLLRAQAAAMFNLRLEETLPLGESVFGPFAGIWK